MKSVNLPEIAHTEVTVYIIIIIRFKLIESRIIVIATFSHATVTDLSRVFSLKRFDNIEVRRDKIAHPQDRVLSRYET